jgi:cytochrome bd-type quinol oxidase subunit 2
MIIISISYIVNILVAGLMGTLLFFKFKGKLEERMLKVYGENTSGRQILACLYLTIAIFSIFGLLNETYFIKIALFLFPFQILYKTLTLISVKEKRNPVPYVNLAISILHVFSVYQIVQFEI